MFALGLALALPYIAFIAGDPNAGHHILMETGDFILMETGDKILLE